MRSVKRRMESVMPDKEVWKGGHDQIYMQPWYIVEEMVQVPVQDLTEYSIAAVVFDDLLDNQCLDEA